VQLPQVPTLITKGQHSLFSWEDPGTSDKFITAILTPKRRPFYEELTIRVFPDKVNFCDKLIFEAASLLRQDRIYVKYSIVIRGSTKIIRFEDSNRSDKVQSIKRMKDVKKVFFSTIKNSTFS
jgi:hypothetical protein